MCGQSDNCRIKLIEVVIFSFIAQLTLECVFNNAFRRRITKIKEKYLRALHCPLMLFAASAANDI